MPTKDSFTLVEHFDGLPTADQVDNLLSQTLLHPDVIFIEIVVNPEFTQEMADLVDYYGFTVVGSLSKDCKTSLRWRTRVDGGKS